TTPADAPLTMKWQQAMDYANEFSDHGHDDWRVPSIDELVMMFNSRAAIGGFNESDSGPAGRYWSSSPEYGGAWVQRFGQDLQYANGTNNESSLRCVRSSRQQPHGFGP